MIYDSGLLFLATLYIISHGLEDLTRSCESDGRTTFADSGAEKDSIGCQKCGWMDAKYFDPLASIIYLQRARTPDPLHKIPGSTRPLWNDFVGGTAPADPHDGGRAF